VLNVPVADEGCLVDVDTPRDYEALGLDRDQAP
jgi:CTP:molybdopterin cytidylyltransferase MocA